MKYLLGIFDRQAMLLPLLLSTLTREDILLYYGDVSEEYKDLDYTAEPVRGRSKVQSSDTLRSFDEHLRSRELFYKSIKHAILHLDMPEPLALSFLTGGILALLSSSLNTLTVIAEFDCEPILKMGNYHEVSELEKCRSAGRLVVQHQFNLTEFLTHTLNRE
jgi:hypothetical protein